MDDSMPTPKTDRLIQTMGNELKYDSPERSFSPWFSDIGLGFDEGGGIARLYLHYNRRSIEIGKPFFEIPAIPTRTKADIVSVRQVFSQNETAAVAFCGRNTWVVRMEGFDELAIPFGHRAYHSLRVQAVAQDALIFDAYVSTADERDPDAHVPFSMGVRVVVGSMGYDKKRHRLKLKAFEGKIMVAFHAQALDVDHQQIAAFLTQVPPRMDAVVERSKTWMERGLGEINVDSKDAHEAQVAGQAAMTLLSNSAVASGRLAGRVASFPSRGRYPTHFLWDSCFHNLALEQMEERLAEDALLLLTENLRVDGKMAHFLCSTWMRPHDSQPPLVGWAGMRLLKNRGKSDFAQHLLPALVRNNRWWLTQRMTSHGLITCHSPFETGWDDTPRFDGGPVVAIDMNSYLIMQLRATAEMAHLGNEHALGEHHNQIADRLSDKLLELCYDEADNLFYDIQVTNGEKVKIKTPACFMPLLADVSPSDDATMKMIEESLLNEELFYGAVPFPSVAYNEANYDPKQMWRGPTWLPIAWLLIELLEHHGYEDEAAVAGQRLYTMMLEDGHLREYFNSQTGEGLGAYEQGWTAAIFLKLKEKVQAKEDELPAILDGSDTF